MEIEKEDSEASKKQFSEVHVPNTTVKSKIASADVEAAQRCLDDLDEITDDGGYNLN